MEPNNEALLASLSRKLRPAMGLPDVSISEPISETLATFADSRHRVGPLLHLACQGRADTEPDRAALLLLKSAYQANVYASLRQKAVEGKISELLIKHSVPFSFLKGRGLAEQLHRDPAARLSKDVDILVSTDRSSEVIKLMNNNGYIYKSYGRKPNKRLELARQDMDIKLFKDLTFFDSNLSVPIELHCRLFKFEPDGLTNGFHETVKTTPVPSLSNSFYCLYLILHGTLAMWPRLKWLVDLSIMLRKMPIESRLEMMDIAKSYGCDVAIAASILTTEEIFSGSLDDDWQSLLEPFRMDGHLREMQGLYYECLTANTVSRPSYPLKSRLLSGSADLVFPGKISLLETLLRRFMNSLAVRI